MSQQAARKHHPRTGGDLTSGSDDQGGSTLGFEAGGRRVSVLLPPAVYGDLEAIARHEGLTITDVAKKALSLFFYVREEQVNGSSWFVGKSLEELDEVVFDVGRPVAAQRRAAPQPLKSEVGRR